MRTLLALTSILAACGASASGPPKVVDGVRLTLSLADGSPADAAAVMQRRLTAGKVRGVARAEGQAIIVDLPALDPEAMEDVRALIIRTGRLELKLIDDGSAIMRALAERLAAPPQPGTAGGWGAIYGVVAEEDRWMAPGHALHVDTYLSAPDREELVELPEARRLGCFIDRDADATGKARCRVTGRRAIERYVADLAGSHEAEVPADRQLVYESIAAHDGRPTTWRSYLAMRGGGIDGDFVERARTVARDQGAHRDVELTLRGGAADIFAQVTRDHVGNKLAIVLDDRVMSAPVVMSAIVGGRLVIALGDDARPGDARELAIILDAGPLPAPVLLESVAELKGGQVVAPPAE